MATAAPVRRTIWWRAPGAVPVLTCVLALVIIIAVFAVGVRRGMDHTIEEVGIEGDPTAVAIALSDIVYGLNAGYLAYASVLNKLEEVWNRGVREPRDQFKNDADGPLLNEGIAAAASLGPQAPGFISDRTLVTMVYEDLGFVDFAKLSFRLFGFKVQSFYYTFVLLLSLSAAAYLAAFWGRPAAGAVLLCTLLAFLIEVEIGYFFPDVPTFAGLRHGSTLALIPTWHFVFLVVERRRASAVAVLSSLVQLAILLLAIRTRGSAIWAVLFVPAVAIALGLLQWRRRLPQERTWGRLFRDAACWPVVLLVLGYVGYNEYVKATLHPVYFTDDVMPYHGYWHSAYIGLWAFSPQLLPSGSKALTAPIGDAAGAVAAAEYMNDTKFMPLPPAYPSVPLVGSYISPWTGTVKFKLHDDIMQRVVWRIAAAHPFGMLESLVYAKPEAIVTMLGRIMARAPNGVWLWLVLLGGLSASALLVLAEPAAAGARAGSAFLVVAVALLFASLPNIWAGPGRQSIADLLLTSFAFLQLAVCLPIAGALAFLTAARSGSARDV